MPGGHGVQTLPIGKEPAAHTAGAAEVLPAAHEAHTPEHAALARPALAPNVPAGQSEQTAAPASEKVPGGQGPHTPPAPA